MDHQRTVVSGMFLHPDPMLTTRINKPVRYRDSRLTATSNTKTQTMSCSMIWVNPFLEGGSKVADVAEVAAALVLMKVPTVRDTLRKKLY